VNPQLVIAAIGSVLLLAVVALAAQSGWQSEHAQELARLGFWVVIGAVAASEAVLRVHRRRRRKRERSGRCAACGYDLTGNVSGICPECGMSVDPP
jgi:hypothetical protein